jgi:hypothetical protein
MFRILAFLILCGAPAFAQSGSPYMDRARAALARGLSDVGQWQTTHVINQTVMQCTSCPQTITVVLRHIDDYPKGSDFSTSEALYVEGRKLHCQHLVASGEGRCIAFEGLGKGITARSIEGGSEVFEHVIPMGTTLLAGYVEGPKDAPDLAAIQDALRHAVARLDPRW